MGAREAIVAVLGLAGAVAIAAFANNSSKEMSRGIQNTVPKTNPPVNEPEQFFAGVPLSELDKLAKDIYHGIKCTIDKWGFLVFHYKSKRGHETYRVQMHLDEAGKLFYYGNRFPGETWSSVDEFAKRANELFSFKKE